MPRFRFAFAAMLTLAAAVVAADAPKPEKVIAYRQSTYRLINWNFGPLGEMVKGKRPFDASEAKLRAEHVAYLSHFLDEAFPAGSDKGATTDAKPAIWENQKDFQSKLADFQHEAQILADTAGGGDEAKTKDQVIKTAGACKACHDKYRAD
jgi:cytochrome c556